MTVIPEWLADHLRAAETPRTAARDLLFHGTIEPFDGPLRATCWERLLWFAEEPEIAQSYCAQSGSEVLTGFASYSLDDFFIPHSSFHETIFSAMGFNVAHMEAERNRYGRMDSYRVLDNHPSNRDAKNFLERLGYTFDGETAWIKVRLREGGQDEIMPASWKTKGRLFIAQRPKDLRLYDLQSTEDGGLTGRQWMRTDLFEELATSGDWDGIIIDDINQSKKLGHFGHRSIGLFQPVLQRLPTHVVECVNADPFDTWRGPEGSTTPEFDAIHDTAAAARHKAAA
ncbi:hypothetical protein [Sphingomonas sp. 3-13AW]|uniref:hypothetical protein n=1 Tax=Sphingomonas sp. 3-13AW TaxID=3050450 RepID=UPI003BB698EC